ncbi:MAG TPA: transketolase [Geobacteraceae bacterium]
MQRERLTEGQARLAANTLRMLAVDAVEQAGSGHPGLPMGAADYAFLLWYEFLRFDPADPDWPGRDRFVLSAGHGSMLLYGLLHLFGYDLSIAELQRFRQWGSRTPGHPEFGVTTGVEVTTGPLGQGFANSVGLALAGRMAAARCGDARFSPAVGRVFVLASDGDLMEGVSGEAASLAGHLGLGNLVCLYDANRITIEGGTELAFSEDVAARFVAYGWQVAIVDGHDRGQVRAALTAAVAEAGRPSLIVCQSHIAWGSPGKQDSAAAHGSPLGKEEAAATRRNLVWPDEPFHIPPMVRELCRQRVVELQAEHDRWQRQLRAWRRRRPDQARLWDQLCRRVMPEGLVDELLTAVAGQEGATRTLAGQALQRAASLIPALVGGSADLAPSTNTWLVGSPAVIAGDYGGRNLHFGVREHAMAAILNGLARSGLFIPFGATFLAFSDYCRPAIRLAALMAQHVVYVFTHDSLFLGEDGPTHQPVEQLASLRLIPNLTVWRPADGVEAALAWAAALQYHNGPTALVLTRQKVPALMREDGWQPALFNRGGYLLREGGAHPDVVLLASGSEVALAMAAAALLAVDGTVVRVISVPCLEAFQAQPAAYRRRLLPGRVPRVAIEAGCGEPWGRLLGSGGLFIGMNGFGASAPEKVLAEQFGFTPAQVADRIRSHLGLR